MVKEYPVYIKTAAVLLSLVLTVYILYTVKGILVPFAFATLLAILLNPLYNWFLKRKVSRLPAGLITLLIALILFLLMAFLLSSQVVKFGESLPVLKQKLTDLGSQAGVWLQEQVGISIQKQTGMVNKVSVSLESWAGSAAGSLATTLGNLVLLPVYIFFILFYKRLILKFLFELFAKKNATQISEALNLIKSSVQSYIVGLLLEALIVATLNSGALLIIGVKYAVLLGVIGALLNMIPYIGGVVAIALPVLMATVTNDGYTTQLWIIAAYLLVQFIDNNILVPRVVSAKVQINGLVSIIVVLLGGALWGIAGMFLSIPFTAILKIIFDRVPGLQPWGTLLGDDSPQHITCKKGDQSKQDISLSEKIVENNK